MKHVAFLGCVLVGLSAASSAQAEPLTFGGINGTDNISRSAEVGSCSLGPSERTNGQKCTLTRTTFGGIPIDEGSVTLNSRGRVQSLDIVVDDDAYPLAYELLVGRYGQPTVAGDAPRWSGFDEGAGIAIRKSRPNTLISFRFPANDADPLAIQPGAMLFVLLMFSGVAFTVGQILRRRRKTRRPTPALVRIKPQASPPLSMRETLERKLRQGDEIRF